MTNVRECERCGAVLIASAPEGLCASCLLRDGLDEAQPGEGGPPIPSGPGAASQSDSASAQFIPAEVPIGARIGRYKLLQKIGEGGCGTVFMAEQEEPVRRRVALKVIKLGMDTRQVVARFEAERQALALMDHPNIAKVFDAGATDAGRPYFVMELVRGIKITEYSDRNHLSTRQRLDLFVQVCSAMQHAHQKGIIHRDIKPSNVLVTLHDGVPVPKVIDFGIAKATEGRLTDQTLFTAFEQFIGTPAYVSPEQAELSGLDIGTRSDIYSLGVLLYELLTGKTPFDAKTLVASGLEAMRRTIREAEPVRPSTRLSTMLAGELTTTATCRQTEAPRLIHLLRGDLDWIVMKCLEKDRTRRYETANGLARDIARYLSSEPVVARPPSKLYQLQKFVRRHRVMVTATVAVVAALLAGTGVSIWQANQAIQARQVADSSAKQAQENAAQAQAAEAKARAEAARADQNATNATLNAQRAERLLYGAEMNLAQQALESGNTRRAKELLESYPKPGREELRDFEWRYLWRLHSGNSRFPPLNVGSTNIRASLAYSPDGRLLASGGRLEVQLWDVATRHLVSLLEGHRHRVAAVAFSPDGRLLASKDIEGTVLLWDVESRKSRETLEGTGPYSHHPLAFFPDGKVLARSSGRTVRLRDVFAGRDLPDLTPHHSGVGSLAISPEGKVLAIGDDSGFVELWDMELGRTIKRLPGHLGHVNGLAFSRDGKMLAVASFGSEVKLWDMKTKAEITSLPHASSVEAVAFSSDGKLATATDQIAELWDPTTRRLLKIFKGHTDRVGSVAFAPDGRSLATLSDDGTIRLWDTAIGAEANVLRHDAPVLTLAFSPDGQRLATGSSDGTVRLWDVATEQELSRFPGQGNVQFPEESNAVWTVAFSPNGRFLSAGSGLWYRWDVPGAVRLWDLITQQEVAWPQGHEGCVFSTDFSPDSQTLVTVSSDQTVRLWDIATRHEFNHMAAGLREPHWRYFGVLSPDGQTLFSSGQAFSASGAETPITLWDIPSGRELTTLPGAAVYAACSRDGRLLATSGDRAIIELWDIVHRKPLRPLLVARSGVRCLAFAPEGQILAAGCGNGTITLWNIQLGFEVLTLHGHSNAVSKVAFSPDGSVLASASTDQTVRLWRAAPPEHLSR